MVIKHMRGRSIFHFTALMSITSLVSGCVIADCGYSIDYRAIVVDAETKVPIEDAKYFITVPTREMERSGSAVTGVTDSEGRMKGFVFFLWACGIFSGNNPKHVDIRLEADSFATKNLQFPFEELTKLPSAGHEMDLGVVELEAE